jgi:hypothetical protein
VSSIYKREVLVQLLLLENFYLRPFLAFVKAKFCLSFFFVIKCEAFEKAQKQSSSRLTKGFLSLFSFFNIGLRGGQARKFPLPFFFEGNLFEKEAFKSSNKIKAQGGLRTLDL